ncbi:hypothetical protein AcV7_010259 [Taiwanofungus camphoratus]|nr:hypothetical protein AcV7_010259 [Antrodia cinnamomea]
MPEGLNVEESRTKRIERLKSRFRDRGGVFVPSAHNALLDILLARGVNGESPSKLRNRRRSAVAGTGSPLALRQDEGSENADSGLISEDIPVSRLAKGKAKALTKTTKTRAKKTTKMSRRADNAEQAVTAEFEQTQAGSSRSRNIGAAGKSLTDPRQEQAMVEAVAGENDATMPSRMSTSKRSAKAPDESSIVSNKEFYPEEARGKPGKRVKKRSIIAHDDADDLSDYETCKTKPKKAVPKTSSSRKACSKTLPNQRVLETDEDDAKACAKPRSTKGRSKRKVVNSSDTKSLAPSLVTEPLSSAHPESRSRRGALTSAPHFPDGTAFAQPVKRAKTVLKPASNVDGDEQKEKTIAKDRLNSSHRPPSPKPAGPTLETLHLNSGNGPGRHASSSKAVRSTRKAKGEVHLSESVTSAVDAPSAPKAKTASSSVVQLDLDLQSAKLESRLKTGKYTAGRASEDDRPSINMADRDGAPTDEEVDRPLAMRRHTKAVKSTAGRNEGSPLRLQDPSQKVRKANADHILRMEETVEVSSESGRKVGRVPSDDKENVPLVKVGQSTLSRKRSRENQTITQEPGIGNVESKTAARPCKRTKVPNDNENAAVDTVLVDMMVQNDGVTKRRGDHAMSSDPTQKTNTSKNSVPRSKAQASHNQISEAPSKALKGSACRYKLKPRVRCYCSCHNEISNNCVRSNSLDCHSSQPLHLSQIPRTTQLISFREQSPISV